VVSALVLGLLAVGVLVALFSDRLRLVIEEQAAARTKAERLIQFGLGLPLPGTPDTDKLDARLTEQGLTLGAPVFIRIFKAESELEVWLRKGETYDRLAIYPICRWSGGLGPKQVQGDRQAPEGIYTVAADQLNPHSRWHRSFNLGFPNALDRSFGRSGTFLMVHGGCSSAGCYAMTDPVIDEIWRLVTAALSGGQQRFHVHIFPFRMTAQNMNRRKTNAWMPFWQDLKFGHDLFEAERVPPRVLTCNGHYAFEKTPPGQDDTAPLQAACPGAEAGRLPSPQPLPVSTPLPGSVAGKSRRSASLTNRARVQR
jgi:murein L,D-transpeptidase YafK